ncbi:MAG: helix-turn-helix domain-containing protein [Clostridia bacterium]|nr:helix-turn-helix domain-containing protein [Clostridia bacterium]
MLTFSLDTLPEALYVGRIRYEAGWQNSRGEPHRPGLYYVYSGRMRFSVNGESILLTSGTALLLDRGYPYTVAAEDDCDYCYFHFMVHDPSNRELHFEKCTGSSLPPRQRTLSLPLAKPLTPPREQAEHLAHMILQHAACEEAFDKVRLDLSLLRLLLLLGEDTTEKKSDVSHTRSKNTYLAIREYIESHYAEELSLSQISERMDISPQYAARIFRQFAGRSVTTFIQQVRLRQSEELLRHSSLSISQIAFAAGFSSPYYYSRLFSRTYGTTPTAFRRAAREEV